MRAFLQRCRCDSAEPTETEVRLANVHIAAQGEGGSAPRTQAETPRGERRRAQHQHDGADDENSVAIHLAFPRVPLRAGDDPCSSRSRTASRWSATTAWIASSSCFPIFFQP